MSGFYFLGEKEIKNLSNNFYDSVIKGPAALTDFCLLQGATAHRVPGDFTNYGMWWLKDCDYLGKTKYVNYDGNIEKYNLTNPGCGARLAIKYSEIKDLCHETDELFYGYKVVTFGGYPLYHPGCKMDSTLESYYRNGLVLNQLDFSFTTMEPSFKKNYVYMFNGKYYVRYNSNKIYEKSYFRNHLYIMEDEPQWIEVMPVPFIVDKEDDLAISKDLLFSGIPNNHAEVNFDTSFVKMVLDNLVIKEMLYMEDLFNIAKSVDSEGIENIELSCDYDLSKVTEEDIIKGAVESDISVFLHGKSSDGKSARIKKLDPDCEIIYMRNATPDSLNGKSVYDASTGKMIDVPPSWYKKIVDKCSKEPDKIHLVFFDELTNALPSMQGMAFNIILDREVNGKWKLPKNARIVAAGNDLQDSLAANKMAEPLFNRFAHVYINTEVDNWLEWAMDEEKGKKLDYVPFETKEKINPDIISYIEYRASQGFNALRTPFTGIYPNADPRKWEMASKMLYKTNKPEMLRALIGEDLTKDFIAYLYCKQIIDNKNIVKTR